MRRSINKNFPLAAVTMPSLAILSLTIFQHIWTIAWIQFQTIRQPQTCTKNFEGCGRVPVCTHVDGCLIQKNCCGRYQQRKVDLDKGELPCVQKLGVLHVRLPSASTSRCVLMLDLIKRSFLRRITTFFGAFGILDTVYCSCKGFVPRNRATGND